MEQDFDVSDMKALLDVRTLTSSVRTPTSDFDLPQLWIINRATLQGISTMISRLTSYLSSIAIKSLGRQSLAMSRANVVCGTINDRNNKSRQTFIGGGL